MCSKGQKICVTYGQDMGMIWEGYVLHMDKTCVKYGQNNL